MSIGNGTITGLSAGGLPNGSVQQADLAPNVAGTGPAFSAYRSTSLAGTHGAFVTILFDTAVFNEGGSYTPASGRFQPSLAGYYHLDARVQVDGLMELICAIFKNGGEHVRGTYGTQYNSVVSGLVYLNGTTDYVDVRAYHGGGAGRNYLSGIPNTSFNGYLARAA